MLESTERLDAALFRHLIANAAIPLIGSALGALLVAISRMGTGDNRSVFAWLGLIYAVTAIRAELTRRCRARLATIGYERREAIRYALSTSMSGVAWGAGTLLLGAASPIATIVTVTSFMAMAMGSVFTLSAFMPSLFAFLLPSILPLIVVLFRIGGTANLVLAVYTSIFLVLVVGVAARFNETLRHTWQLVFENEDLVAALTEAHGHMAKLADTDGLTGIANRRRFDEVLQAEFARLRRSGAPLSLIFLDADHFKAFNDTYGHVAGDECLKKIAEVLQRVLNRAPDFAARYGGEEFAGILPDTDFEGALTLAERIRSEVAALEMPHDASGTTRHITASLGVITVDCSERFNPSDAIALSDRELYRAKAQGRNRVAGLDARGTASLRQSTREA